MELKVLAFGIAKDILGGHSTAIEVPDQTTIESLKKQLVDTYPAFDELASLRIAINESYEEDHFVITAEDEVVIIPPVSGG